MRICALAVLAFFVVVGCDRQKPQARSADSNTAPESAAPVAPPHAQTLAEARKQYKTKLIRQVRTGEPVAQPPADVFSLVHYNSPAGSLAAYLTPNPHDNKQHPAIIWITGGDCNSIGEVWEPADPSNDQTAAAYRQAGIVMLFPSLRGGNDNPASQEKFYGEVDDVLAAADFLATEPYVDPNRIYLGGHSTGGTLALLVSECSDRFRAVFSFGPVDNVLTYGVKFLDAPFNIMDRQEIALRAPGRWLESIKSPTFVIEGDQAPSNRSSLETMQRAANPQAPVHFVEAVGYSHFSILAPANRLIAQKILADTGPECNVTLTVSEIPRNTRSPSRARGSR